MQLRLFGWTFKAYHKRDAYGHKEVLALIRASEGKDRYIKQLEMALDKKGEEIARLKRRASFSLSYVPAVAAAVPEGSHNFMCEVCEKPLATLFTVDADYPNEQYCQGH